jgi:Rieske Fe-S protein
MSRPEVSGTAAHPACHGCPKERVVSPGRRKFMQGLLGTGLLSSVIAFVYPVLRYLMPVAQEESTNAVSAAKVAELKLNSGRVFKFGNKPGLVIHTTADEWKAFVAVCPHLNCTVQYRAETQQIWCACHNGTFDLNGQVISGPPPKPLEQLAVNVRGDDVVVSRRA